jgi:hypothetical protein
MWSGHNSSLILCLKDDVEIEKQASLAEALSTLGVN